VRAFLGLSAAPTPAARTSHVGPDVGEPHPDDVAHLRAIYAEDAERLETLTGIRFGAAAR
jgi:hypothetical protein